MPRAVHNAAHDRAAVKPASRACASRPSVGTSASKRTATSASLAIGCRNVAERIARIAYAAWRAMNSRTSGYTFVRQRRPLKMP